MENILKKEALCALSNNIEITYRKRITPILLLLLSVGLIIVARRLYDAEDLSTIMLTVGVVVLIVAVVKLIAPSRVVRYKPTGEKIVTHTYNHPIETSKEVERALRSGDLEYVATLAAKENAPLMTVLYSTPSGRFVAGQTLQYIPYEYTPLFEAVIIEK
ncbi:MAG: hypothetical protein J6R10_00585 [Tidjanibacter sp.]|nr:hypothetical protein [Tidjanibacter sp.]